MTVPLVPDAARPVVDDTILTTLTARLGERAEAFRETLLHTWYADSTQRLDALDRAAADDDLAGAGRAAHALKSGSATLGALRLSGLCEALERAARAGEDVDLSAVAAAVRAEVGAAAAAFGDPLG